MLNKIEIGKRYDDDSGWRMLFYINRHRNKLHIEIESQEIDCSLDYLDYIIKSLYRIEEQTHDKD